MENSKSYFNYDKQTGNSINNETKTTFTRDYNKFCAKCSEELLEGFNYCKNCGATNGNYKIDKIKNNSKISSNKVNNSINMSNFNLSEVLSSLGNTNGVDFKLILMSIFKSLALISIIPLLFTIGMVSEIDGLKFTHIIKLFLSSIAGIMHNSDIKMILDIFGTGESSIAFNMGAFLLPIITATIIYFVSSRDFENDSNVKNVIFYSLIYSVIISLLSSITLFSIEEPLIMTFKIKLSFFKTFVNSLIISSIPMFMVSFKESDISDLAKKSIMYIVGSILVFFVLSVGISFLLDDTFKDLVSLDDSILGVAIILMYILSMMYFFLSNFVGFNFIGEKVSALNFGKIMDSYGNEFLPVEIGYKVYLGLMFVVSISALILIGRYIEGKYKEEAENKILTFSIINAINLLIVRYFTTVSMDVSSNEIVKVIQDELRYSNGIIGELANYLLNMKLEFSYSMFNILTFSFVFVFIFTFIGYKSKKFRG